MLLSLRALKMFFPFRSLGRRHDIRQCRLDVRSRIYCCRDIIVAVSRKRINFNFLQLRVVFLDRVSTFIWSRKASRCNSESAFGEISTRCVAVANAHFSAGCGPPSVFSIPTCIDFNPHVTLKTPTEPFSDTPPALSIVINAVLLIMIVPL